MSMGNILLDTGMPKHLNAMGPAYLNTVGMVLLDSPRVLVCSDISSVDQLLPTLELAVKDGGGRPLLVVASTICDTVYETLVVNHVRGVLRSAAVQIPPEWDNTQDILQAVADTVGAVVATAPPDLDSVPSFFGSASWVGVSASLTAIVGGDARSDVNQTLFRAASGIPMLSGDTGRTAPYGRTASYGWAEAMVAEIFRVQLLGKEMHQLSIDAFRSPVKKCEGIEARLKHDIATIRAAQAELIKALQIIVGQSTKSYSVSDFAILQEDIDYLFCADFVRRLQGLTDVSYLADAAPEADAYLSDVKEMVSLVQTSSIPFFRKEAREKRIRETCELAKPLLERGTTRHSNTTGIGSILQDLAFKAGRDLHLASGSAISELCDSKIGSIWNEASGGDQVFPPSYWVPCWVSRGDRSVPHPAVSPGQVHLEKMSFTFRSTPPLPGFHAEASVNLVVNVDASRAILSLPVLLNLDELGGFVANDKRAIEVAAIDLLAQLPGGQVKVDVVDPQGMGGSSRFLYDLNDAGDRILADAIWTTPEQINKVLLRTEEHIAFVTQKYLQGRHSLTDYNVEAGEIAEPYRLLIFYDYPSGFSRDGSHYDEEQLTRLQRIIGAGRRAGVFIYAHVPDGVSAQHLAALPTLTPAGLLLPTEGVATSTVVNGFEVLGPRYEWSVIPHEVPTDVQRRHLFVGLIKDLQSSDTTRVEPETVARLARAKQVRDASQGLVTRSQVDIADPTTWWRHSSQDEVLLTFGRMGASDVARVSFNSALESSALIGGRTGSGKSYLVHALIMDAVTSYSPDELTLYLCDLKEGVEFKQYADANLPHARAIAIESNREFALSLLEALDDEITQRGALFKTGAGGATVNLAQFRRDTGQVWPRVLIVVDEFHKLFEQDDALARKAMQLLERVIKEGRAFGVHTILASQSLANVDTAFRSLSGQIPYRLVLSSSDHDSRLLLGDDNSDAKLLTKAGEGILNAKGGARESNQRFRTTFWAPEKRQSVLDNLRSLAAERRFVGRPHVFEGNGEVAADDYPATVYLGDGKHLGVPVGVPMSMAPPVLATVERAPGGNVLVVDSEGQELLATMLAAATAQGAEVTVVSFAALEPTWDRVSETLGAIGVRRPNYRKFSEVVQSMLETVDARTQAERYDEPTVVLALAGTERARDLDPEDYADDSSLAKFRRVVKFGPEVGVHTVCLIDRKASLDRRLDRDTQREFGLRVLGRMSGDDSRALVDTERAASLTSAQVLFDDFDKAVTLVARRLQSPGAQWIESLVGARR